MISLSNSENLTILLHSYLIVVWMLCGCCMCCVCCVLCVYVCVCVWCICSVRRVFVFSVLKNEQHTTTCILTTKELIELMKITATNNNNNNITPPRHNSPPPQQFVLTGGSAGGLSTFLHSDRVAARVRAGAPGIKKIRSAPVVGYVSSQSLS